MGSAVDPDFEKEVLTSVDELARPLEIIYRSLVESGDEVGTRMHVYACMIHAYLCRG